MDLPVEKLPLGVPLTREVLDAMGEEERAFWLGFLEKIDELRHEQLDNPLPEELVALYQVAVERYGGLKYCQVMQIQKLYDL